ncbi:hypothetical protein D5F52_26740 (plasmid) [Brevibacillus laterosporus]|uniref:replication-relaxation family protein n=1 Tax=Brevibacillus laterosporus TaxID=1465 RepID=UPI000E6D4AC8|nr:replication-relaxation family protein [Brevibacillus laterosporus]AYB41754.1 hypothetical protein D5F52_26740 [Brevibacillus laterosporus]
MRNQKAEKKVKAESPKKRLWAVKRLTQRDLEILFGLHKMRTLTIKQIHDTYFSNNGKGYTYLRLHQLKMAGLVECWPLVNEEGRKNGACYCNTDKGINILIERGLIDSTGSKRNTIIRKSSKNRPSKRIRKSIIEHNGIFLALENVGWEYIEQRDYKRIRGLNRGSVIKGGIKSIDGKEYALYILEKTPREFTLEKIIFELKNSSLKNIIILMKGKRYYNQIVNDKQIINEELNILPFRIGVKILKRFPSEASIVKLFTSLGEVSIVRNRHMFGKYVVTTRTGEQKYICNYLLGDEMAIRFLKKYTWDRYELDGKKVVLFIWDNQFLELGKGYEHVEIVQIPFDIQV